MPVYFLTDARRAEYGRYTDEPSPSQLAQYFHYDDADRERQECLRGDHNRLGYALQLGTVRFLGTFVTDLADVPEAVVRHVGTQVEVSDPIRCVRQYRIADTHRRHARAIREAYGYHRFTDQPHHLALVRWLFSRAWLTGERPSVLFDGATQWLIERKVLLPGASVLERLVARDARPGRRPPVAPAGRSTRRRSSETACSVCWSRMTPA